MTNESGLNCGNGSETKTAGNTSHELTGLIQKLSIADRRKVCKADLVVDTTNGNGGSSRENKEGRRNDGNNGSYKAKVLKRRSTGSDTDDRSSVSTDGELDENSHSPSSFSLAQFNVSGLKGTMTSTPNGSTGSQVSKLRGEMGNGSVLSAGACAFEPATPRDDGYHGEEELSGSGSGSGSDWFGLAAPKFGTPVPNRIFVGGISCQTTENDLIRIFQAFGNVRGAKIIFDRGGVSKGYGFVTFETEEEATRLCTLILKKEFEPIILRDRRLNIAPAIKKQPGICSDSGFASEAGVGFVNVNPASAYYYQNQFPAQAAHLMQQQQYYEYAAQQELESRAYVEQCVRDQYGPQYGVAPVPQPQLMAYPNQYYPNPAQVYYDMSQQYQYQQQYSPVHGGQGWDWSSVPAAVPVPNGGGGLNPMYGTPSQYYYEAMAAVSGSQTHFQ